MTLGEVLPQILDHSTINGKHIPQNIRMDCSTKYKNGSFHKKIDES
jgi:hypothetical protein